MTLRIGLSCCSEITSRESAHVAPTPASVDALMPALIIDELLFLAFPDAEYNLPATDS
jgi:hypothetical protein